MRSGHLPRRGIAILEALILIALIVLLAASSLLFAENADNTANRIRCASNLRQIGQAILLYANENRGAFPRAIYDPEKADKPMAYTNPKPKLTDEEAGGNVRPPFCKAGPGPNDITAAMFLLILTQDITPEVFTCPTARAAATTQPSEAVHPMDQCNFTEPGQLDYSFVNVYPNATAVDQGYKIDTSISAEFAIAADINPGVEELLKVNLHAGEEEMKTVNSPNHDHDGQNVLYGDGHVEFQQNPFCGVNRDNIYTYGKSGETSGGDGIIGSPTFETDSILLPTAKQGKVEGRESKVEDRK